jgi:uncharacterized membrane protein YdjX (TVP38/TMEM64 family)
MRLTNNEADAEAQAISAVSPRRPRLRRYLPLLLLIALGVGLWAAGAQRYLDRHALIAHAVALRELVHQHPVVSLAGFLVIFAVTTAVALPDITLLTLTSGYLFGPWLGGLVADVGATAGAVLIFAAFHSSIGAAMRERAERSGGRLKAVLDGVAAGAFGYMVTIRMLPGSPFWPVSVAATIAGAPFRAYVLGTCVGVMPAVFVYAGLGSGLGGLLARGELPHIRELLSPAVTLPLVALALLSLAVTAFVHRRRIARLLGLRTA